MLIHHPWTQSAKTTMADGHMPWFGYKHEQGGKILNPVQEIWANTINYGVCEPVNIDGPYYLIGKNENKSIPYCDDPVRWYQKSHFVTYCAKLVEFRSCGTVRAGLGSSEGLCFITMILDTYDLRSTQLAWIREAIHPAMESIQPCTIILPPLNFLVTDLSAQEARHLCKWKTGLY